MDLNYSRSIIPKIRFSALYAALICWMSLGSNTAHAQVQDFNRYNIQLGFYAGPVNYIGDYNAWLLGSAYTYNGDQKTPQTWNTGDLDFGVWTKFMLKPFLYIRTNAQFGSLTYSIKDLHPDYNMQTPYSMFGLGIELQAWPEKNVRPYLGVGFNLLNYKSPPRNMNSGFSQYSSLELRQQIQSYSVPVTLGIDIQLSDYTTLFFETAFHYTGSDQLDNFAPPSSETDALLETDALISYRAGIGVSIVDLIRLKFGNRDIQPTRRIEMPAPQPMAQLKPSKLNPESLVPEDSLEATRRRLYPERYADQTQAEDTETDEDAPIPVVDPENREFEPKAAVEEAEQMMEELEERIAAGEVEDPERARARIPRVIIKPDPMSVEMTEEGVVTSDPPEGYYVQVYASIGPISAQRARRMAMQELEGIVQSPERQVIITKRKQFYEVRIGVFDSYDDTIGVLGAIEGTFFDAYTLIFTPEEKINE
ncbi:MAG: SPOR domain-containing protein [Bacteroidota bacterium]